MTGVLLFSYGTLQDPAVQTAHFGRRLAGTVDGLAGFVLSQVALPDPEAEGGASVYPVLIPDPAAREAIPGVVLEMTEDDLPAADAYEGEEYRRVVVSLTSGLKAWVYIAA